MGFKKITADEAAALIRNGECVGVSGLTAAGAVKVVPAAIARKALSEHEAGREFRISLMSGGSTHPDADGILARSDALERRMPYQSNPDLRGKINGGDTQYIDMHLSVVTQAMRYGHIPKVDTAIVEVSNVSDDGELTFTTSSSNNAGFCMMADRIILELNTYHSPRLCEIHDVFLPDDYPNRQPINITKPWERVGRGTLKVDPAKIVGVVETHLPDPVPAFKHSSPVTDRIGLNIVRFLEKEYVEGRIPKVFSPIQSGIGNVANAVLMSLKDSEIIPPFCMYTEVAQNSVIDLLKSGRCKFVSSSTITVTEDLQKEFYENFDFFKDKILLRPTEISNNPEVIRRMGVISMNTAIEADIFGNVNSTHFFGKQMMNGIGGSCDYARAAAYTIFSCPSTAKNGTISSIVPMVSHTDQPEHDVDILVTEQGVADLRGKSPRERARLIINNCAHPDYRPLLNRYLELSEGGHTPHTLEYAFSFHTAFLKTGDMRNVPF